MHVALHVGFCSACCAAWGMWGLLRGNLFYMGLFCCVCCGGTPGLEAVCKGHPNGGGGTTLEMTLELLWLKLF